MTFKDKPKRDGGKTFSRDRKPKGPGKPAVEREKKPAEAKAAPVPETVGASKPERISKIMARAGVASRRDVERMIMEGRVSLNGVKLDTPVVNQFRPGRPPDRFRQSAERTAARPLHRPPRYQYRRLAAAYQ
jgi:23S rRNA pseudouridine2605 synthase